MILNISKQTLTGLVYGSGILFIAVCVVLSYGAFGYDVSQINPHFTKPSGNLNVTFLDIARLSSVVFPAMVGITAMVATSADRVKMVRLRSLMVFVGLMLIWMPILFS